MKAAEHLRRLDSTDAASRPRTRRPTSQALMRASGVVVGDVLSQDGSKPSWRECNHVVQAFASNRADHALDVRVLPGRLRRGSKSLDSEILESGAKLLAIRGVTVAQEKPRPDFAAVERAPYLVCKPCISRMSRDGKVQDLPAIVGEHHEHIEQAEGHGRHDEQVARRDLACVIPEESEPALAMARPSGSHAVLRDRRLGKIVAEEAQLELQAWHSPERVLPGQSADQENHVSRDRRSARLAGFESPEQAPALAVPVEHRLGLHEHEAGSPALPEPADKHPERPIPAPDPRSWRLSGEDIQLDPEGQILGHEGGAWGDQGAEEMEYPSIETADSGSGIRPSRRPIAAVNPGASGASAGTGCDMIPYSGPLGMSPSHHLTCQSTNDPQACASTRRSRIRGATEGRRATRPPLRTPQHDTPPRLNPQFVLQDVADLGYGEDVALQVQNAAQHVGHAPQMLVEGGTPRPQHVHVVAIMNVGNLEA